LRCSIKLTSQYYDKLNKELCVHGLDAEIAMECLDFITVQGSMAINGIFRSAVNATTTSFSAGRSNIKASTGDPLNPLSISDDAASLDISDTEKGQKSALDSALRNLSPLQNIVDAATRATDRASEVLNKTLEIAKRLETEVDPTKISSLSSDGAALLEELDSIASEAKTPNGVSVLEQGVTSYSLNLDKQGNSKGNSIAVSLPNIVVDRSSLGLQNITSSTLKTSNEENQETIQQAIDTISNIQAQLKSAGTAISNTASLYGASRAAEGKVDDKDAGTLAEQISATLKDSPGLKDTNNLDAAKVLELLKEPDVEEVKKKKPEEEQTIAAADDGGFSGGFESTAEV
jgi:hypothetical protein